MVGIPCEKSAMRIQKILGEDDVAIRVADVLVFRDLLGAIEHRVEAFCAELGAKDFRFVTDAELAADFSGAGIVTEEDDFDVGMKEPPGLKCVALDHVDVTEKRFGGGEEGEHRGYFGVGFVEFALRRTKPPSA